MSRETEELKTKKRMDVSKLTSIDSTENKGGQSSSLWSSLECSGASRLDNDRSRAPTIRERQRERGESLLRKKKNGFERVTLVVDLLTLHLFSFSIDVFFLLSAPLLPLPLRSLSRLCGDAMKETREAKQAASEKPTPRQRQRSLLESLGVTTAAAPARPTPPLPPLRPGQQRSLDGLAKVVRKNRGEEPCDVLSRCLGTLRGYQRAVGGDGGGATNGGAGNEATAAAGAAASNASSASPASTAPAPSPATTTTATEDQARAALRELSCVRVDASLISASGAGAALRRFRKDAAVAVSLSIQAEKILGKWKEDVTSEVRARKKLRANDAATLGERKAATPRGA